VQLAKIDAIPLLFEMDGFDSGWVRDRGPARFRTIVMKVLALACDYDGTLAHDGVLDDATTAALDRFLTSGSRLLMVTGRELPDLQSVCRVLDRFEW
jgi:hypothetical protein